MFTILAILIACLGLFGLASYTVEQRTKEVGIRKVFGADNIIILRLISRDFLILVSISILIAFPVAWYFMSRWLENYVYRNKLGISLFISISLTDICNNLYNYRCQGLPGLCDESGTINKDSVRNSELIDI